MRHLSMPCSVGIDVCASVRIKGKRERDARYVSMIREQHYGWGSQTISLDTYPVTIGGPWSGP